MEVAAHAGGVRARGLRLPWACAAVAFLLAAVVVGTLVGPIGIGIGDILGSVGERLHLPGVRSGLSPTEESIIWELRIPRVVLGALVGGMLALAGATYQGVFRNPLVDPYLLGIAAGPGSASPSPSPTCPAPPRASSSCRRPPSSVAPSRSR